LRWRYSLRRFWMRICLAREDERGGSGWGLEKRSESIGGGRSGGGGELTWGAIGDV